MSAVEASRRPRALVARPPARCARKAASRHNDGDGAPAGHRPKRARADSRGGGPSAARMAEAGAKGPHAASCMQPLPPFARRPRPPAARSSAQVHARRERARVVRQQDYWDSVNLAPGRCYSAEPKAQGFADLRCTSSRRAAHRRRRRASASCRTSCSAARPTTRCGATPSTSPASTECALLPLHPC